MRMKLVQKIIDKIRKKNKIKIKHHPNAVSRAESMQPFAKWVLEFTDLKPKVIFEIGANYGQDAEGLRRYFNANNEDVYVFEAHPDICAEIPKLYGFKVFNNAVFNEEKIIEFNVVNVKQTKNSGISSLYKHQYSEEPMKLVKIPSIRMDDFMNKNNIAGIDFLKLDAEGCNWEVLDGFGDRLKDVKVIHLEAEHKELWQGEKLFDDIKNKMEFFGFEMVFFQRFFIQSDSMWIKKEYIKSEY